MTFMSHAGVPVPDAAEGGSGLSVVFDQVSKSFGPVQVLTK